MAMSIKDAVSRLAAVGYCLSGKVRPVLIDILRRKPTTVGEMAKQTKLAQPLVSHHLKKMHDAGLLVKQRDGKSVVYAINGEKLTTLVKPIELLAAAPALPTKDEAEVDVDAEDAAVEEVAEVAAD